MNANQNLSLDELEAQVMEQIQSRGNIRRVVATSELRRCVSSAQQHQFMSLQERPKAVPVPGGGLASSFKRFHEEKNRRA